MNETVTYNIYTNSYIVEDSNGAIEIDAFTLDESLRNDPKFISAVKKAYREFGALYLIRQSDGSLAVRR